MPASTESVFVSTTPGLERALAEESRTLGDARAVPGGVDIRGPLGLHRRANLELRTASRVQRIVARFTAADAKALRSGLDRITWAPFLPPGARLALDLVSQQSPLRRGDLQSAIPRSWPVHAQGELEVRIRAEGNEVTVGVDTSGELLYRRGYRQEVSRAPLRETLAAGILRLASYDPSLPLWDPMCGSGTLPIEAAWIALNRAPGLDREFLFTRFPSHDEAAWAREREAARARIRPALPAPILATDLNAGSLGTARRNARRAALEGKLILARHDATRPLQSLPRVPGLVVANLPYGKRVGEGSELDALYAKLGQNLRASAPGWRVALLAEDRALLARTGLAFEAELPLDNGGIRCTLALARLPVPKR